MHVCRRLYERPFNACVQTFVQTALECMCADVCTNGLSRLAHIYISAYFRMCIRNYTSDCVDFVSGPRARPTKTFVEPCRSRCARANDFRTVGLDVQGQTTFVHMCSVMCFIYMYIMYTHTFICIYVYIYIYIYMCVYIYTYTYIHIFVDIYTYICIYIYIYTYM